MKRLAPLTSAILYFLAASAAFVQAATPDPRRIQINRPSIQQSPGGSPVPVGFATLGDFIQKTLTLLFIIGILVVLAMLIWGAFEWIASGGDKEAVGKARGRIINALVGMAILAIAFALFQVVGQFLGFNIRDFIIPTPEPE